MKKVILVVGICLMIGSVVTAQNYVFKQVFSVNPNGDEYCDSTQLTFAYDSTTHFTDEADYTYEIELYAFDAQLNVIHSDAWQTTGWMPAIPLTHDSGSFGIVLADQGGLRVPRNTAYYTLVYRYTYLDVVTSEELLIWEMNTACDVLNNSTYSTTYTLIHDPYQ